MQEGEAIENSMVTRRIEKAQKKVEEYHFDQRKNLLEYDEVMDLQRKRVYGARQEILDGMNPRAHDPGHDPHPDRRRRPPASSPTTTAPPASPSSPATASAWSSTAVALPHVVFRRRFALSAIDQAVANVPTFMQERIEENLNPGRETPKDWKWGELTRAVNARYDLKTTEKELTQDRCRSKLTEHLIAKRGSIAFEGGEPVRRRTLPGPHLRRGIARRVVPPEVQREADGIEEIQTHSAATS